MSRQSFDSGRPSVVGGEARQGTVTHQTVKLSSGKHSSPDHGACVMELASMLAGEPFSDHPQSVCPVIASFLRAYNDAIDDHRRQDLYAYASRAVGSRAPSEVQRARAEQLDRWAADHEPWWARRFPRWRRLRMTDQTRPLEEAGAHAARTIRRHTDRSHAEALALIDELLAIDHDARQRPLSGGQGGDAATPAGPAPVRPGHDRDEVTISVLRARHTAT